jgi:propionyl-CoA carboxylase alpha chain
VALFSKILIANRGEIACRVIRTARAMGIQTVAVYSEADRGALHVEMADEAVHIGPAPAAESYLDIDKILGAIKETGSDAVHPGYGFLSENAGFVEALEAAGVAFIGPGTRAIAAMGDKIESKKLADASKVTTVPGHLGVIADADEAVKIAGDIGYPVMIKASAGGGGKGMRVAFDEAEAREGFDRSVSEAMSSFGDDRVFIEKYIVEPRHIEIQVLADKHGNTIFLGERECSIQRRHQKVIEEAPSPVLDEATRQAMGAQAVALAQAVEYSSAGTVEFIVDQDRNFYFLEMNTRLQVEHPVTELITGIDLVEQMIRVAAGEELTISQDDVVLDGWAIESRLYAEDPVRGFLPSIGRLSKYMSATGKHVRVDTGVVEGDEISRFYDPMIAKLCTHGDTREEAVARMADALDQTVIRGIGNNVGFLSAVMTHPRFQEGRLSTNFIADEYPDGYAGAEISASDAVHLIAVTSAVHCLYVAREMQPPGRLHNGEIGIPHEWVVGVDDVDTNVQVSADGDGIQVRIADEQISVRSDWTFGQILFVGSVNDTHMSVEIKRVPGGYRVGWRGIDTRISIRSALAATLAMRMPKKEPPDLSKFLLSPMPGLVVSIDVSVGDTVQPGQTLAVIDAMKMENVLTAERLGVVSSISVAAGDNLATDQVIMEFDQT